MINASDVKYVCRSFYSHVQEFCLMRIQEKFIKICSNFLKICFFYCDEKQGSSFKIPTVNLDPEIPIT